MSVVVETRVPADDCVLGAAFEHGARRLVFERTIPTGPAAFPLVWAFGVDAERFRERLAALPAVAEAAVAARDEEATLYHLSLRADGDGLVGALEATDGFVREGRGTADGWRFVLQFADDRGVRAFQRACRERDVKAEVVRFTAGDGTADGGDPLTEAQRETIRLARQEGYYGVPRRSSLTELGEELGVSGQAVSTRLRRGIKALALRELFEDGTERD